MTHDLVITLRQKSEQLVADFDLNDDDSIDFYEFCDMISLNSQQRPTYRCPKVEILFAQKSEISDIY